MKKTWLVVLSLFLALSLCAVAALGLQVNWQREQLQKLTREYEALLNQSPEDIYDSESFNYLALGNSITRHGKCNYWWNEIGMAATRPDRDYFHIVTKFLEGKYGKVTSQAYGFAIWETQSTDRTQTFNMLTGYLSPELDLITVQLSENAKDLTTFVPDLTELITYLQRECPKATIILVDDFWSNEKSQLKRQVAENTGVLFASLAEIRGLEEYKCGLGTIVYDANNQRHVVTHSGVANHPGDAGMSAIATAIIEQLIN